MTVIVFGATGLLGQALVPEIKRRGRRPLTVARKAASVSLDVTDTEALTDIIANERPAIVINAAAITDIAGCDADPRRAHKVNTLAPGAMAEACRANDAIFVQISTDHYYTGDGAACHSEDAPVRVLNEYARTKHEGEKLAQKWERSLIVRTNFTGLRGWQGRPTFLEWVMESLRTRAPMSLFDDYFTSTIDTTALAKSVFDLVDRGATGVFNVAAREVASKEAFVRGLADAAGVVLDWAEISSLRDLEIPRAESLGLDVSRAEEFLGYRLPTLDAVLATLAAEYGAAHTPETMETRPA